MKKMVASVRWFRVVALLVLMSALLVGTVVLPTPGRLGIAVLLLLIVSAAVRYGWAATRSTIDAEART